MSITRFLGATFGLITFFGATASFIACTTTTERVEVIGDGGGGGDSGNKAVDSGGGDPDSGKLSEDECLAKCEKDHATGLAKDKAIDSCWDTNCKGPCVDGTGGFDGGGVDAGDPDGGDGGAGTCKYDPDTGDVACDQCTAAFCCASWDGCFDDQDCTDLNDCRNACIGN